MRLIQSVSATLKYSLLVCFVLINIQFKSAAAINEPYIENVVPEKLEFENIVKHEDDYTIYFVSAHEQFNSRIYALKQLKSSNLEDQIQLIIEKIVSDMAYHVYLPIPKTRFMSMTPKNTNLLAHNGPILLQEIGEGETLEELGYPDNFILQKSRSPLADQDLEKKFGPLPDNEKGLTLQVLKDMQNNDILIGLVALDTVINNADRNNSNVLFNSENNQYIGINHLSAFTNTTLARHALNQIKSYWSDLSDKEQSVLLMYYSKIKEIAKIFSPKKMNSMFLKNLAELFPKETKNKQLLDKIEEHISFYTKNYEDLKQLIAWFDTQFGVKEQTVL